MGRKSMTSKKQAGTSPSNFRIIQAGTEIHAIPEPDSADIAFMARQLVQATLPHSAPKGNPPEWSRQNGNLVLSIRPGYKTDRVTGKRVCLGYPYGTIPRLLLFWITTEAIRTRSRKLILGKSLRAFMKELGLDASRGGPRSDSRRLQNQMERLFRAVISFEIVGDKSKQWLDMQIAPKGELWWDFHSPDQQGFFHSWIELHEDFFKAITSAPVPVDMRALSALKNSAMALDMYAFVCYRAFVATQSGKPQFVRWEQLMEQLGTDHAHIRNFRAKAGTALQKIRVVYPGLIIGAKLGGIQILPGTSAVPPRPLPPVDN